MKRSADDITRSIGLFFATFGGNKPATLGNPISEALKDRPLMFAAGVDVKSVVEFVIDELKV